MEILKTIGLMLVAAFIALLANWFWFRKNRTVKQADEEDSDSKQARQKLASELEGSRQKTAEDLESRRQSQAESLAGEHRDLVRTVDGLKLEVATLKAQAAPINAAFAAVLVKELTHYHTPVMDELMQKTGVQQGTPPTLTKEEEVELVTAMKQRTEDMGPEISNDERDAAEIFPALIRRVRREAAAIADGAEFAKVHIVGSLHGGEI